MDLWKNGRLTAQNKKKYQYKYSTKRKTFSSIIQAQSIGTNLTEMKTLIEKGMMLGLKKGKKIRHQIEATIQKAEAELKLEIVKQTR